MSLIQRILSGTILHILHIIVNKSSVVIVRISQSQISQTKSPGLTFHYSSVVSSVHEEVVEEVSLCILSAGGPVQHFLKNIVETVHLLR